MTASVDYSRGSCSVEDDGSGIFSADFEADGGLGKHCCESVCFCLFVYFGVCLMSHVV